MSELSKCCKAPVKLVGGRGDFSDHEEGITMHYECSRCGEMCDLYVSEQDIRDSMPAVETLKPVSNLEDVAQQTIDHLYKIDGDVTPEQYQAIDRLRQLINEEFVGKGRQMSSQLIYDILKEVL